MVYAGGESMPPEQVNALVAGMIVEDGVCRPPSAPAGAQIEGIQ